MAGRARWHALSDALERRTRDTFDDHQDEDQSATHLDFVCEWLECGRTIKELAAEFTEQLGHDVTHARIMAYLRERFTEEETERRLDASRLRASHSLAEHAIELVDAHADNNVDVSRAASRARTRQWMAERYNPQRFGSQKGTTVSISVGSLHLTALQSIPNIVTSDARTLTDNTSLSPVNHVQPTQQQALRSE